MRDAGDDNGSGIDVATGARESNRPQKRVVIVEMFWNSQLTNSFAELP